MLKPVLCFHMTSFNYSAKGVRDVDPACRYHQSNIMHDNIFSVNIAWCLTCFTNYLNYESRFNGVFSKNKLPRTKDRVHVINFYDKNSKEDHWVSLFIDRKTAGYFNSFGIEYFPPEVLNKIRNKSITHNIFRIQDNKFIMCGILC